MSNAPTDDQIEEQLNSAYDQIDEGGSRWPGMSYEQGVAAALEWMAGDSDSPPMEG